MEWLAQPDAWLGLVTLVFLEIVLGIDNLVFIAILAEKLPPHQRDRARLTGLGAALAMRLFLLVLFLWGMSFDANIFSLGGIDFSWHNLILLFGGAFLLAKGTLELHERLEGSSARQENIAFHAVFWHVIVQIVVLDAVFSLDSIITATGMMRAYPPIIFIAVIGAMAVMMWGSGPLMRFVNRHPTVVILCLGFLMMIGFSLVVEGFGFSIPKGYLYAAIGFSVLIESLNQIGRRNREKLLTTNDLRERTAGAVLRLLGGDRGKMSLGETLDVMAEQASQAEIFHPEEKQMIRGVLDLSERPVRSIMSPRHEVEWLDLDSDAQEMRREIEEFKHSRIILARGKIDEFVGIAFTRDLLFHMTEGKVIDWHKVLRQPHVAHENTSVLRVMEQLRRSSVPLTIVVDEHGSFEGVVTPTDFLEAIAGDFPDDEEDSEVMEWQDDQTLLVEGFADIRHLSSVLACDLVDEDDHYTTLAGYMLWHFGHLPAVGEAFTADGYHFEVVEVERRNIAKVRITVSAGENP